MELKAYIYDIHKATPKPRDIVLCHGELSGGIGWYRARWTGDEFQALPGHRPVRGVTYYILASEADAQLPDDYDKSPTAAEDQP